MVVVVIIEVDMEVDEEGDNGMEKNLDMDTDKEMGTRVELVLVGFEGWDFIWTIVEVNEENR